MRRAGGGSIIITSGWPACRKWASPALRSMACRSACRSSEVPAQTGPSSRSLPCSRESDPSPQRSRNQALPLVFASVLFATVT